MLKTLVERTQTFAMASAKDSSGARTKLNAALDRAVERHGAEWERNLVTGWQSLDSSELDAACKALGSRDQATFMKFTQKVGPAVQSRNEPVLKDAGAEVLAEIWN